MKVTHESPNSDLHDPNFLLFSRELSILLFPTVYLRLLESLIMVTVHNYNSTKRLNDIHGDVYRKAYHSNNALLCSCDIDEVSQLSSVPVNSDKIKKVR